MNPFIKKIRTMNGLYIYDVNTNSILKVDETIFSIIDDIYDLSVNNLIIKWENRFNKEQLISSVESLKKFIKERQVFSSFRPKGIRHPFSTEKIKEKIASDLMFLVLEITQRCNMNCYYCCYSGKFTYMRRHKNKSMSFSVAKKALDFFLDHSNKNRTKYITFYGGEPLLEFPLISECVNYVNNRSGEKIYFGITTNGTLLNESIIKFMKEYSFLVTISLDGPIQIHDRYRYFRSGRGSYDSIMKKLIKFRQLTDNTSSPKLNLNITICPPYRLHEIKGYFDSMCKDNELLINPFYANVVGSDLFCEDEKIKFNKDYVTQINDLKKEFRTLLVAQKVDSSPFLKKLFGTSLRIIHKRGTFRKLDDFHYPNGICIPGWQKLFVDASGVFYICEKMTDFYSIGNIYNGMNLVTISRIIDNYCNLSSADCSTCWAIRFCKACYDHANREGILSLETKRKNCEIIKKNIEGDLRFYIEVLEENSHAFDYLKNEITYDLKEERMLDIIN